MLNPRPVGLSKSQGSYKPKVIVRYISQFPTSTFALSVCPPPVTNGSVMQKLLKVTPKDIVSPHIPA